VLCRAVYGDMYTYDGERLRPAAAQGDAGFNEWLFDRGTVVVTSGTSLDRMMKGAGFEHILDATDTDAYRRGGGCRDMIDVSGTRTQLSVVLRKDGALLGVIAVHRREVRPFTDQQIALRQSFAAQAVIAIENARLIGERCQHAEGVAEFNRDLEARVAEQVEERGHR
jgi:two-component system, NtrC family, sensor kinase